MHNIERISDKEGVDYYQIQHFMSESKWDANVVVNQGALEVSTVLPKKSLTGLIIDESGGVKKGDKSVRVGCSIMVTLKRKVLEPSTQTSQDHYGWHNCE